MKILYSHFGIFKKGGWGRTFSLADGLADLGNDVTLITVSAKKTLRIRKININNVKVVIFPDIFPEFLVSKGFGGLSLILKLLYSLCNRYDLLISDSGHRPGAGWPCLINKYFFNTTYIAEWWDYFGKGGQLKNKPLMFKIFFGWFERRSEIFDKKQADGIIVLSNFMKNRALNLGFPAQKIMIIHGGCDLKKIKHENLLGGKKIFNLDNSDIVFGYIGMSEGEIPDLEPFLIALSKFDEGIKFATFGKYLKDKTIKRHLLQNKILEMGWIDYDKDYKKLGIVDVFVLIKEENQINLAGWPNKLGDYLACGKPVLLNPYGDIHEFVDRQKDIFYSVERDIDDIVKVINKIRKGERLINGFAEKIINVANENSWINKAKEIELFYKQIHKNEEP
ncbi:hypothetical protein MASR1M74_22510 [Lentimicrobium sp.]